MEENNFGIDNFLGEELLFAEIYCDQYCLPVMEEESTTDLICLYFKIGLIQISPVLDTDEINLKFVQGHFEKQIFLNKRNIFTRYSGQELNQAWVCTNSNGYFDLYVLGFSYLDPNILIYSGAGKLKLLKVK